jgi:Clr5-like protein
MVVSEEDKRRIINLHFDQGKTIREVCRIMGKSSHDIAPVTKEYRIRLGQNYALANGERNDIICEQEIIILLFLTYSNKGFYILHMQ